jgi:hypothetical protein
MEVGQESSPVVTESIEIIGRNLLRSNQTKFIIFVLNECISVWRNNRNIPLKILCPPFGAND